MSNVKCHKLQLYQLTSKTKHRKGKRVGRGGKRGTYSGRGIKGQKARAGRKIRPQERDLLKQIPKLRGYKFRSFRPKPALVNLEEIDKKFKSGETVSPESLLTRKLISRTKGKMPEVKVLGMGEVRKKLIFRGVEFSRSVASRLGK